MSHNAEPNSALPPTALDSILFLATMNKPRSKAKAMRAMVAPNEAKQVVKQVPWKPRMWARSPKTVDTRANAPAVRTQD